ncbi:MAG TPA: TonB-dependent receptor [Candidatus Saccharimonadales bacterium]|nr:TonB-dependent receptor [Candidatus Saccharimonadales bacterium]
MLRIGRRAGAAILLLAPALALASTEPGGANGTLLVRVRSGSAPVASAEIVAGAITGETDERGEARLSLHAGERTITVSRLGFAPTTVKVVVRSGESATVTVQLREQRIESEVVVVRATRSGKVIGDQAIRVEALPEEEIEENLTIAPGNLTTLLEELGGLRVESTAPAMGGAGLRLQGLSSRYTQVLLDDLPLYGGGIDDFSLLQSPPLDLSQVEVIKGASSALYGGSALGGVVNLVSRSPDSEPEGLVNRSSRGATDAVGFIPHRISDAWGYTLLGGVHGQTREDVDGDGWADLPGYRRAELRPRFFWRDDAGSSLFLTAGGMSEDRLGGTVPGGVTPAGSPFREELRTRRYDTGLVGRFLLAGSRLLTVRASATGTWHDRDFGGERERDLRGFALTEAALSGSDGGHTWVAGAAARRDWYRARDLPEFDFTHLVPAVFAQDEYALADHLRLSANGRVDFDDQQGAIFSPLVSVLVRPGGGWNLRLSAGAGYSAPVPFTDETGVVGFSRVLPLRDAKAERARTSSFDVSWSGHGLEVNGTLFGSEVFDPLVLRPSAAQTGSFEIVNASGPTRVYGSELLARFTAGPLQMIASYTYEHSSEVDPSGPGRSEVPLTPRHFGELAGIWEKESRGRAGLELSYTGRQRLEHDPFRAEGVAYLELNALGEVKVGEVRIFANAVNLTNVRQTRYDPLVLPAQEPDGRWTTDVWAPLEGRIFNAGVKMEF